MFPFSKKKDVVQEKKKPVLLSQVGFKKPAGVQKQSEHAPRKGLVYILKDKLYPYLESMKYDMRSDLQWLLRTLRIYDQKEEDTLNRYMELTRNLR
jgi:hypothetical protein